ncbi:helix-turn-helix domain-containing protein [Streptomyces sp. NPDC048191]|uniref:helix-turn-helix domain-containing protein n=1 Tax=Streptomyces sp. NPDC048191 TaxID=3155484 RepID=UPI0033D07773
MTDDPVFDDEHEVYSSDAPPAFTMVPEWITYSDLKPAQREFWTVLASCVNHDRPDNRVWPAGPELADAMRIKNPDQLKPYREALQSIGAVVIKEKRYANGMRRRYVYDVRFHPPKDYTGPRTRQEWLARRKERLAAAAAAESADTAAFEAANPDETAGQPGTPKNSGAGAPKNEGTGTPENGGAGAPENGGAKPDQHQPDQHQPQTAPSARSAGNGRRPSTGSSARGTSSGSAAASGAEAPNGKSARSGREVLVTPEVQLVLEAFPDALREALLSKARTDRPKTVIKAIEEQLAGGGLVQARKLGARVARRWVTHGYTNHHAAGRLTSPVGATVAMLKPGPCPDPRCEDGEFDDGSPCRACIERDKNYRADRDRERKATAAQKEAEARRRGCPHCQLDRGTAGQPCEDCTRTIASVEREAAAFVEQALTEHRAQTAGDDQAAAAFRAYVTEGVEQARKTAAAQGADVLGQALAARVAADGFVQEQKRLRERGVEQVALAAPADRPDPAPEVGIPAQAHWQGDRCPGHDRTGCPWDRPAVGYDGLCTRCRTVLVQKEPAHTS